MNEVRDGKKRVYMELKLTRFQLPPVRDILVIGKKASIGANAVERAFEVMLPGIYKVIRIEHPIIEAVMIRKSILRKLNEDICISKIIGYTESIMDETDSIRIEANLELRYEEEFEVE